MTTIRELLAHGRRRLAASALQASPREAALLLGEVLGLGEARLLARHDDPVDPGQEEAFAALLARRLRGEPVAYLLGRREFFGRTFRVDRRVLIPRPETEHLVEAALVLKLSSRPLVLDLGTGSGCLAVTLALELPAARVVAVDLSAGALALASANAAALGAAPRVAFVAADLGRALDLSRFDLVVSNPPYVEPGDAAGLPAEVAEHEPHLALFAPAGSRAFVARLLDGAVALPRGSHLLFEIGFGQLPQVESVLAARPVDLVEVRADLAGIPRVVVLRRR